MMDLRETATFEHGSIVKIGPYFDPGRRIYVRDEWTDQRATVEAIDTQDAFVTTDGGDALWIDRSRLHFME